MTAIVKQSIKASMPILNRYASTTTSAAYVDRIHRACEMNGKPDFLTSLEELGPIGKYPQLMTGILHAEKANQKRGLFTGVHATPAILTPSIEMATALDQAKRGEEIPFYKVLRAPREPSEDLSHYKAADKIIYHYTMSHTADDWAPEMKEAMLSMSYALFSNATPGESALYFGLKQNPRKTRGISKKMAEKTLKAHGFSDQRIQEILQSRDFTRLLDGYRNLKTGNLIVFGIPDKCVPSVYDSYSYGLPTGDDPRDVVAGLVGVSGLDGHQARMILSDELVQPTSGLKMVMANDPKEVEKWCKGIPFEDPHSVPLFERLLPRKQTPEEVEEQELRAGLGKDLGVFTRAVVAEMPK